jgi:hypothetical protein
MEFAFLFILSFMRQPHMMNELDWSIFGHKMPCREQDDAAPHLQQLPVCLEKIRSQVLGDVKKIIVYSQLLEVLNIGHWFGYLWGRLRVPKGVPLATVQVAQAPAYSCEELNSAAPLCLPPP